MILPDVYLELATDAGVFSPTGSTQAPACCSTRPPPRRLPATCSTWAAATARSPACWRPARRAPPCGRSTSTSGRSSCARGTRPRPAWPTCAASPRATRRCPARFAGIWSNPPVRDRQASAARAAAALAGPPGPRRPGVPGGRAQPRRRLTAPLAGRAGLARDAPGRTERLPPAAGWLPGRTNRGDSPVTPLVPSGGKPKDQAAAAAPPRRGQATEPRVAAGQRTAPGRCCSTR